MSLTKQDVLNMAKEANVKFIRLQFTDIFGIPKNVAIPVDQLGKALDGELMFDGSSIEGFVRIEESDQYLRPDPNTFTVFPWRPRDGSVARLICDVYTPDEEPFAGCPRCTLQKVLKKQRKWATVLMWARRRNFSSSTPMKAAGPPPLPMTRAVILTYHRWIWVKTPAAIW